MRKVIGTYIFIYLFNSGGGEGGCMRKKDFELEEKSVSDKPGVYLIKCYKSI